MSSEQETVLAIDPGSSKCGIAVLARDGAILHHSVITAIQVRAAVLDLLQLYSPSVVLIGDGTSAEAVSEVIRPIGAPIEFVDEKFTTLAARKRYFIDNPPRGLRRLIPVSLQTPSRPYDDYVAIILAERYLAE